MLYEVYTLSSFECCCPLNITAIKYSSYYLQLKIKGKRFIQN